MPKPNILITGANGFIGQALLKSLDRKQYNVFALDSQTLQISDGRPVQRYFQQDITSSFKLEGDFDWVFHFAALNVTHVGKADDEDYRRVNVLGTENLLRAVHTRQFVFMSTVKVYRERKGDIDEDSPLDPRNGYERSKLEAEEVCRRCVAKGHLTIFRAVNVVGPGQAEKAVIPVFFRRAMQGEPLEIIYSGQTPLQMLHIEDLLQVFYLLLTKNKGIGTVNLCPDETITLAELAQKIQALCGSRSQILCPN